MRLSGVFIYFTISRDLQLERPTKWHLLRQAALPFRSFLSPIPVISFLMAYKLVALAALGTAVPCLAYSGFPLPRDASVKDPVCVNISDAISTASALYWPGTETVLHISIIYSMGYDWTGSLQYQADIAHYATSSTQQSNCSVEPGNEDDVAKIVRLVIYLLLNHIDHVCRRV